MTVDYYRVVKKIANTYASGGYACLWDRLKDLKETLYFNIVYQVVDKDFLKPRNSNSSTRVFGIGDSEINDLAKKCRKLEHEKIIFINTLLQ